MTKVSTAEFIQNYVVLADLALSEPVTITSGGQDRLVVISVDEYSRLKRRDRRALGIEEFSEAEIALIASIETPPGNEHLDAEMLGWPD